MYNLPNNSDFNSITTPGIYRLMYGYIFSNAPDSFTIGTGILIHNTNGSDQQIQIIYSARSDAPYIRRRYGVTWGNWVLQPTRTEIDAMRFITNVGASGATFTIPNGYRGVLHILDSAPAKCGEYILWATGAGAFGNKAIAEASEVIIRSDASNRLTIIPSSGNRALLFTNIQGTISLAS